MESQNCKEEKMTSIHPCLDEEEYGKCPECKIAQHCQKWRGAIVKIWNEQINKNYQYLDFETRKEIISELFVFILKNYNKFRIFEACIKYNFSDAQKEFIKKYGLTGNFIYIKTPPANIEKLINDEEVKKYFLWDRSSKRLVFISYNFPKNIYEKLLHEAHNDNEEKNKIWKTILNEIKRKVNERECGNLFERKNVNKDVGEIHQTEEPISASGPEKDWQGELVNKSTELNAILPSEEQISYSTPDDTGIGEPPSDFDFKPDYSLVIEILSLSSSEKSKECQELFKVHMSKKLKSKRTAEKMGWSDSKTRGKLKKCRELFRNIVLQFFGSRCYQLFRSIESIKKETKKTWNGAIVAYAKQHNLNEKTVKNQLHKCRVEMTEFFALHKLEQANG